VWYNTHARFEKIQIPTTLTHAEMESTTPAQPGSHVMSVVVVVQQGQEETVVAQVSSVFTVVQQLNFSEIEYNYLPMEVVCNGVWRRCLWCC